MTTLFGLDKLIDGVCESILDARGGKPPKVAITACMRKLLTILNAITKAQSPWRPA